MPGFAEIDQVQRTADPFEPFLTNVEVSRRAPETAVTQQSLKGKGIDSRFQQVGREGVRKEWMPPRAGNPAPSNALANALCTASWRM